MIYAENNIVITDQTIEPANLIGVYKGTMIHAAGTEMNGTPGGREVDVVAAFNEVNDPDLLTDVGWVPTLFLSIDETNRVIPLVESLSGPRDW
jgi:pectate lyase